jgi:hypothetical protein
MVLIKGMSLALFWRGELTWCRHTPEPARPSSSFDLGIFEEPREHSLQYGRTLPTPSPVSSLSVVAPMDVYLRYEESHGSRMMRLSEAALQQDNPSELYMPPAETCSWEFIDVPAQIPNTPVLQPALSPKSTGISSAEPPRPRGHKSILSASDMSELALSVDSKSLSDDTETYKEAVAEYKAASKRYQ